MQVELLEIGDDIEQAWIDEVKRRKEEIQSGKAKPITKEKIKEYLLPPVLANGKKTLRRMGLKPGQGTRFLSPLVETNGNRCSVNEISSFSLFSKGFRSYLRNLFSTLTKTS